MPYAYFGIAAGSTLSNIVNLETIVSIPPRIIPEWRIRLLPDNSERALNGVLRRDGAIEGVLRWDVLPIAEFNALVYAVWGGFTRASRDVVLTAIDESDYYSPFTAIADRPQEGENYQLVMGGASVENLVIPLYDLQLQTLTKSANYTMVAGNLLVYGDTTSGNVTLTLPAASAVKANVPYSVQKIATSNTLSIARAGSDTINGGSSSLTLSSLHSRYTLVSDGTSAWRTI